MAHLYFYKDGVHRLKEFKQISSIGTPKGMLAIKASDGIHYFAGAETQGTHAFIVDGLENYYGCTTSPTIAFRKNGTTYYCEKDTLFEKGRIPAGVYTPDNFLSLIQKFIPHNAGRQIENNVTLSQDVGNINSHHIETLTTNYLYLNARYCIASSGYGITLQNQQVGYSGNIALGKQTSDSWYFEYMGNITVDQDIIFI